MPTEPPSLFQGHVPAIMSAGQGTHIVFMAEVHSLQGLPGYALHQVLWHPVGKKPHRFILAMDNKFTISG